MSPTYDLCPWFFTHMLRLCLPEYGIVYGVCIESDVPCLMWHVVCAMYPRGRRMSRVGLLLGGSCWRGGVWEIGKAKFVNLPHPPNIDKTKAVQGKMGGLGKWDNGKTSDHWGTTLENKTHRNYQNKKNVQH